MKRTLVVAIFVLSLAIPGFNQVITVTPALPTDIDDVEIIFDASQGNAGLMGYTGDIYAHTGVLTNLSTSPTDWKHVKSDWGVNIPECKLSSLGNNKWKLILSPSIREYYAVPASEQIEKLAFVFRSGVQVGGSWLEGKTESGGDIFYDVYAAGLSVKITSPDQPLIFTELNQPFTVSVSSSLADSTILYNDGQRVAYSTSTTLTHNITPTQYGRYLVKAVAKSGTEMKVDSFYYYVRPEVPVAEMPEGILDGINYIAPDSVVLCLYAPLKEYAFVIGDFNAWLADSKFYMNRTPDGKRYWCPIGDLVPGKEYIFQYFVDGSVSIGDPYATKVSDPWNDQYIDEATYPGLIDYPTGKTSGVATVLQTNQPSYNWQHDDFIPPAVTDMVIYELLIRDFTEDHNFQSVIDTLDYLERLGINAIEFMPVSEFEGNLSWGYNPNYYFALDKYYGTPLKFKELVDACHERGIAVIIDMVLNHAFGTSPYVKLYWDATNNRPSAESPFYNPVAKHDFNVGNDMNHESTDSRNYINRVLQYWINEFHVDGYRFDLSKGFTQKNTLGNTGAWGNYDESRVNILTAYHDVMKAVKPSAVLILEHLADNSEEKELANRGMLLWGNMNNNYCQAAMGYTSSIDLSWASYTSRSWSVPNLVTYMESHDEERQMFKCLSYGSSTTGYSIKDTTIALKRAALTATFFLTIPGPKMIWQFGEQGYDYSINYPSGTSASRLDNKPPRWDYMSQGRRVKLNHTYASLIQLKKENDLFRTTNISLDLTGVLKKIRLKNESNAAVILGNFGITPGNITPSFYSTGTWYDYLTGDSIVVTNVNEVINLKAGEARLYMTEKVANPNGFQPSSKATVEVTVTPNPMTDRCLILIQKPGTTSFQVSFFNLEGARVSEPVSGRMENNREITWYPSAPGIYLIKVEVDKAVVVKKVVVL